MTDPEPGYWPTLPLDDEDEATSGVKVSPLEEDVVTVLVELLLPPFVSFAMEALDFFGSSFFFLGRPLLPLALDRVGFVGRAITSGSGQAVGDAVLPTTIS